jgi:DNA-binding transcriptional ArsR family regulator
MELVFKALADLNRRQLVDTLHARDGQTLLELSAALPGMTRFGTMKHLRILESAGLVVTRREGRLKRHFLNPLPIQRIHDRWFSKFNPPAAAR